MNHEKYCRVVAVTTLEELEKIGFIYTSDVIGKAAKAGAKYSRSGDIDGMKDAIKKVFRKCKVGPTLDALNA